MHDLILHGTHCPLTGSSKIRFPRFEIPAHVIRTISSSLLSPAPLAALRSREGGTEGVSCAAGVGDRGGGGSRKDHYWNSCHPLPRRCRESGARRPESEARTAPQKERERRDKSGIEIGARARSRGRRGAIRLELSTTVMDSNANIVAVAARGGEMRMGIVCEQY